MKKHKPIHNLGVYAHAPSPKSKNHAGPLPGQTGNMKAKLIGKEAPPANVSKPRMKKV